MNAWQLVDDFLRAAPRSVAVSSGEALATEIGALERAFIATCDDGSKTLVGYRGQRMFIYRLSGEAIDMFAHDLRGARLTTHRKSIIGGLLTTGYTLEHPYFPRGGKLQIDATRLDDADRDALPLELERFLAPATCDLRDDLAHE